MGVARPVVPQATFHLVDHQQVHRFRRKQLLKAHPELEQLFGPYPPSGLLMLAISVAQLALGVYLWKWSCSGWIVSAVAYTVGAALDHAIWVLVHDATHDLIFHNKVANQAIHLLGNLPLLLPATMSFRYYHRMHHAFLNETYNDPDMPDPLEARIFGTTKVGKLLWMFFFAVMQALRLHRYRSSLDAWTVAQYIIQGSLCVVLYMLCGWQALTYLALSSLFAIGLHPFGARWIAEHYNTHEGQETYSYYGALNKLSLNIGYHNEHHDLPKVAWVHLPRVTAIAPEFYDTLAEHSSYVKLLAQFIWDERFTLETRVVHPSTVMAASNTILRTPDKAKAAAALRELQLADDLEEECIAEVTSRCTADKES